MTVASLLAIVPMLASASIGFLLLERGVIAPIHDLIHKQGARIDSTQRLRILSLSSMAPVDEYVEEGSSVQIDAYRHLREQIEWEFAAVIEEVSDDPATQALLIRAREAWSVGDRHATILISAPPQPGTPQAVQTMHDFHGALALAGDRLKAAYLRLVEIAHHNHEVADLNYERAVWLAMIGGSVSLLMIFSSIVMINGVLIKSVGRLVEGASKFAEGDRDHRIQIQVPPELQRVADEFNYMIERIDETEKALDSLAHIDALTGIQNRRSFENTYREAALEEINSPRSVLIVDIDHFKRINDTFGHAIGDQALQCTAKMIQAAIRPFDRLFRIGGEEFAVLTFGTDVSTASEVAEQVRHTIEANPVQLGDQVVKLTVSIGVAGEKGGKIDLEAADRALYQAKKAGRNQVVVYENLFPVSAYGTD